MKAEAQTVPNGYMQTDVGVIPQDWEPTTIGDVAIKVGSGITPRGGSNNYKEHGRPFIRSQNVGWGKLLLDDLAFITDDVHKTFSATEVRPGDVLLNITGASIGRTALATDFLDGGNVNQHVCIIRLERSRTSPKFVNSLLLSDIGQRQVDSFQAGGNREGLNFGQIRSMRFALPPTVTEQEAIAEVLTDADASIASLEQLLAKKRDIKHGAMQELLTGKKRLHGFSGKWDLKRLGDIGESLIGLTYKPTDVRESGVLVLRSSNIYAGALRFEDNVFVDTEIPDRIMVRPDDILICVRNGSRDLIGKCAKIDERAKGMTFGAFMAVFRTSFHEFVFHQFQSDVIKRQINEHLGATINQITNKSLNSFEVPLPPTESEQLAIADILSDMEAEIAAIDAKLSKARQIKQGMMQELLTGRIRLV